MRISKKAKVTRRSLLQGGAALAFPLILPRSVRGACERLNIAAIGAGGKGATDIGNCASENIVALCDVDEKSAAPSFKKFPEARRYRDYRKMLDEMGKSIDAVTVSTADHSHAVAELMAMRMGKHVYGQKPLTRTVHEARVVAETAREKKVATQMGNQGHSNPDSRRLVELIRAGVLGKVAEIHVWTDRPIWPQGVGTRPAETPAVPEHLDWDLWLGPAPERPYHPDYHPFKWRGWWDFGTGALGDMGCHNLDLAFFSLGLKDPVRVSAETSGLNPETAPSWSVITYEFAGTKLTWYDGKKQPSPDLAKQKSLPLNGTIMIGDKDTLYVPMFWGGGSFLSGAKMEDFKEVPQTLPRIPGFDKNHYQEWIAACKGGPPALSNFDYAGPMTEAVLLGNVAMRLGKPVEWDPVNLKAKGAPEADKFIRGTYRPGWSL